MKYRSSKSGYEQFGFKEQVNRMQEGQNDIYCITGECTAAVSSSPSFESLRKKGLKFLDMVDLMKNLVRRCAAPRLQNS